MFFKFIFKLRWTKQYTPHENLLEKEAVGPPRIMTNPYQVLSGVPSPTFIVVFLFFFFFFF